MHFLDDEGHIKEAEYLHVEALNDALEKALSMLRDRPQHHSMEIWRGTEKVYPNGSAAQELLAANRLGSGYTQYDTGQHADRDTDRA